MHIEDRLLTPGVTHGRNGKAMTPQGIVIHYVGNPGSSALANRLWFENGAGGGYTSAHYIIGLNGEIIRCVPDNECAAHAGKSYGLAWDEMSKTNNSRLLGIENCHPSSDGKFNNKTLGSLVDLVAYLCIRYKLDPDKDVYRHYDVSGKSCPLYYVNKPEEWTALKTKFKEKVTLLTAPTAEKETATINNPSSWAEEAWTWAKQSGITDGTRPDAATTREESITFIYRLYTMLTKK